MLKIININTYYGQAQALKNVSLHLTRGEIVTLLGANGAGKTTLLNSLSGVIPPRSGQIIFDSVPINNLAIHQIVRMGISHVPEGRQVFKPVSVEDNLELGAYLHHKFLGDRNKVKKNKEMVYDLFPILRDRKKQLAGTLSGGEQQMLAIGRALMTGPKLILLDEPSMGLAPMVAQEIFRVIGDLSKKKKTTVLLVEQNARAALKLASRGYVLETGRMILEGTAAELLDNKDVQRAYLGKDKKEIWER
ncbi:MAG: ABC transporter ATP-binding protein [Syntrophaceae bacterium]|nr:ABC transporter ATP-binding protein [Syntrophaceae bacterium]